MISVTLLPALSFSLTPRQRGILLLNVLCALFGSNMAMVKEIQTVLAPAPFAALRFGLAAAALAPWLPRALGSSRVTRAGIELGLWASLGFGLQSVSLLTVEASRASFLAEFTVLAVPLLSIGFGRSVSARTLTAAALAMGGCALLESGAGGGVGAGDLCALLSAAFFGLHILRTEMLAHDVRDDEALPLISLQTGVVALAAAAVSALASADAGEGFLGAMTLPELAALPWPQLLWTGVVTTAGVLVCEVYALRDVSAAQAAIIYTLEPIWGAAIACGFLGERMAPLGWVGAAVIVGSSLWSTMGADDEVEEQTRTEGATLATAAVMASGEFDGRKGARLHLALAGERDASDTCTRAQRNDR